MSLNEIKAYYIDSKVQIIAVDSLGTILSSDDILFKCPENHKIQDIHPFFYALLPLLETGNVSESFPCINLDIEGVTKIVDITILDKNNKLYVVLTDFTSHYQNSHPLVQTKNETVIASNKLLFERELLFAKESFKNNFLAHLNHEIRNPLNALLGFTELLGETKLDFQQKETLGVIHKTGLHIKVLMDDLLDISKIETGDLEIKEVPFNLYSVVASMTKHFQIKKEKLNIDFSHVTDTDVPFKLYGDPTRLNQILYNLLENAYRNTTEGTIKLQVSLEKMISKNEASIQFIISDTGQGISETQINTIFDSYIQLELEKEKPIGNGLGLKVVKDLSTLLNGNVTVKSEVGKGSQFTVTLPLKIREKARKKKTIPKGTGIVMSKRILVVENDTLNQMLFVKQFIDNDKGYSLELAPDPDTAYQMLDKKNYLAVVIKQDYNTTTGIDFVKKLKKDTKHSATPILVVSGKAMVEEQNAILDAGASAFLKKPYTKKALFLALQRL
ncbi:hybrid sensory kinase [unidentified eubacterium SCB49]|nr:hybrid sensory kinase [unidentified eubacterium SCB49]